MKALALLFGFCLFSVSCSDSGGGAAGNTDTSPTEITTSGTFNDSRSAVRAPVNFTLVWQATGTEMSGTYTDDHYATSAVNFTGTFLADSFSVQIDLPSAVSGASRIDLSSSESLFASDGLDVSLKDGSATEILGTTTSSLSTSSEVEIDDIIEGFVGNYTGRILNQFGGACPAENAVLTAQVEEIDETDGAQITLDITGVGTLVMTVTQMPYLGNYYLAIASTANQSHTFVGSLFTNGATGGSEGNGTLYDNGNDCSSSLEFAQN